MNLPNDHPLSLLRWHRLSIQLINIRASRAAKAHPLSVFQAIIKGVTLSVDPADNTPVFFHLKDKRHTFKIHETQSIPLELFFCGRDAPYVSRWRAAFQAYIKNPDSGKNFDLIEISEAEERSLDKVALDVGALPEEGELCLEFLTPIPFSATQNRHRTYLTTDRFISLFTKRFQKLFGIEIAYPKDADDFKTLPYYWNYTEIRHASRSQPGQTQYINGCAGKLYLKGRWHGLLPFLILGTELHAGADITFGRGYYKIDPDSHGCFDFFPNQKGLIPVIRDVLERYDDALETLATEGAFPFQEETLAAELCNAIREGTYAPSPNTAFFIPKKDGSQRIVERLEFRDLIVQQYLLGILTDPFDRMFEEGSIGFRRGMSREKAISLVQEAVREGYVYVIESDIESFFPSVDLNLLIGMIEEALPSKEILLKALIKKTVFAGYTQNGAYHERIRGLAQGSPLSPLLANLYLDSFDEEVQGWDVRMIRYADDFIIMVRSREEAETILSRAEQLLSFLHLAIKKEKTAIKPFAEGFDFLGMTFDMESPTGMGGSEEELWNRAFKKPLYLTEPYLFLSLNGEAIAIKKGKETIETLPLRRISEIMVMEKTVFSTALLARCCANKIPFTIALNSGYYITTIKPDSKQYYEVAFGHAQKYAALSDSDILCIAKEFAAGKLNNYITLFRQRHQKQPPLVVKELRHYMQCIYAASDRDQVRGFEAAAAKRVYQAMNDCIENDFFRIRKRERKKPDAINSLMNFSSYLLFSRINATVRGVGLNPYLGFLHHSEDTYESLVCDIEELFRARIDRLILRVVNLKIITKEDFADTEKGCYLKRDAIRKFIFRFEEEMERKSARSELSMKEAIYVQGVRIKKWAMEGGNLAFYEWKE